MMQNYVPEGEKVEDKEDNVRDSYVLKCPNGFSRCFREKCKSNYTCGVYDGER